MKAGNLDRKVSIQEKTETRDAAGQPIETWEQIGVPRSAQRLPVSGSERFTADQFIAREQVEWRVRWSADLADLNALHRVVYPVTTSGTVPDSRIYDVMAVHEIGRREGLRIVTARRPEL